jgi:hypothetical protein
VKYSIISSQLCNHLSFNHLPTFSPYLFANLDCSDLVILFTFCSKSSANQTDFVFIALDAALPTAQAIGTAAHNHAHKAKSLPLGNSLSDTIEYIHISAAHSVAQANALAHNGSVEVANGIQSLLSTAIPHSFHNAAVCVKSDTTLLTLYAPLSVSAPIALALQSLSK